MKKVILILLYIWCCNSEVKAQLVFLGLSNTTVTDLFWVKDTLYAATSEGIFKKSIIDDDTVWMPCGLNTKYIVQFKALDFNNFLALTAIKETGKTQLYKSSNGGVTFEKLLDESTMPARYLFLDHLATGLSSFDTIYSLFHKKKTFDGGKNWLTINDFSLRFIKVNPNHSNEIYIGGENNIFSAEIKRSSDFATTFETLNMLSYFTGDNTVHDMVFINSRIVCVGEGVISYSDDQFKTWTTGLNTWQDNDLAMYIFDIEKSTNGWLYASGSQPNQLPKIILHYSNNNAESWNTEVYNTGKNQSPQIKCMTLKNSDNEESIFLGGAGVYRITKNTANIHPSSIYGKITIYPNPSFDGKYWVNFQNNFQNFENWKIYDLTGNVIQKGTSFPIILEEKGLYFISLKFKNSSIYQKIIFY